MFLVYHCRNLFALQDHVLIELGQSKLQDSEEEVEPILVVHPNYVIDD